MNNGYFFRLNKNLSKTDAGIAIYDYIDLPAYFESSRANLMSPKYPISVSIRSDAVEFRVHYSVFRNENKTKYFNSTDEIRDNWEKVTSAHMEEVILELPFTDNHKINLHKTIRDVYSTSFPQPESGGKFLAEIIKERFQFDNRNIEIIPDNNKTITNVKNLRDFLYQSKRNSSNSILSYSSLEIMGFDNKKKMFDIYDEHGNITGFLRKLMLDFMFDFAHSDIFQNSSDYMRMYRGLMSDYYFSALLHKCEYYYNRHLVQDYYEKKNADSGLQPLYLERLVKSEEEWVRDILSPQSEQFFDYTNPSEKKNRNDIFSKKLSWRKHPWKTFKHFITCYRYLHKSYPSWFADPETEMRRVHIILKQYNSDNVIRREKLFKNEDNDSRLLIDTNRRIRHESSRWFLKRYDFHDLFDIHLFRAANYCLFITIAAIMALLFVTQWRTTWLLVGSIIALLILWIVSLAYKKRDKELSLNPKLFKHTRLPLHLLLPRLVASIATAWFTLTLGFDLFNSFFDSIPSWATIIFVSIIIFFFVLFKINTITPSHKPFRKIIRSIELVFISFMISFTIGIVMVNFLGQNYIERGGVIGDFYTQYVFTEKDYADNPNAYENKINAGRFYIYHNQDIYNNNSLTKKVKDSLNIATLDSLKNESLYTYKRLQNELVNVYHISAKDGRFLRIDKNHPIAKRTTLPIPILKPKIFELRDFTITFAFIAMFMGIFIQLIIFGDSKQMTEL